jgi:hypothetical protein
MKLKRHRQVDVLGIEDGFAERPSAESTLVSRAEAGMESKGASETLEARLVRGGQLAQAKDEFARSEASLPDKTSLDAAIEPVEASFRVESAASQVSAARVFEEDALAKRDLAIFRRKNGLTREARYPAHRTSAWLLPALFAFLLELGVNVGLFAEYLAQGIAAAAALSIGVAFLNGVFGYATGGLARALSNPQPTRRTFAVLAIAVVGLLSLGLNGGYAWYRSTLVAGEGGTTGATGMFEGGLLFLLGLAAAAAVAFKAWRSDDPFPGYGQMDRARKAARARADGARTRMEQVRSRHLSGAREAVESEIASFQENLGRMRAAVEKFEAIEKTHQLRMDAIHGRHRRDQKTYWAANEEVRETPLPTRAASIQGLEVETETFDPSPYEERLEDAGEELDALKEYAAEILATFHGAMAQAIHPNSSEPIPIHTVTARVVRRPA